MFNKSLLLFIFLTLRSVCQGQSNLGSVSLTTEIKAIVNGIAQDNVVNSASVGIAGQRTEQWERFEKLSKGASANELITLTDYKNAVVRCYAFYALTLRKDENIFPILLKHLNDTDKVETHMGCSGDIEEAGEYFLDLVTPLLIDLKAYKLSPAQQLIVDSILLFDKTITISKKYESLLKLKPDPKYYARVREIATFEKNPDAVIALAKYRNKNDVAIINDLLQKEKTEYYGIYAAREFPDSSFYPTLKKIFEKEWSKQLYDYPKWRMLYQALARYPSQPTYKLFERAALSKDQFRYQTLGTCVLVAIHKYPNKIFNPLASKIKLEEFYLNQMHEEIDWVN